MNEKTFLVVDSPWVNLSQEKFILKQKMRRKEIENPRELYAVHPKQGLQQQQQ